MAETDPEKREAKITILRNQGNWSHNCKVIREGEGTFQVTYRPSNVIFNIDDYGPCDMCFATIVIRDQWKHKCKVAAAYPDLKKEKGNNRPAAKSRMLIPPPPGVSQKLNEIIQGGKADEISRIIKSDTLLLEFGKKCCNKSGHDKTQYNYIRNSLRHVARFLIVMRKYSKQPNLYVHKHKRQ